jgi:hypothetical protein
MVNNPWPGNAKTFLRKQYMKMNGVFCGSAMALYNEDATLFLGDINAGTWPSRLGESRI